MAGINKAIIVGRLGNNPDVRTLPNGDPVATLSIATSENWTDKSTGEKKAQTEWHRVVFYRRLAEIAGQYLAKGSLVYIEGSIHTRKWQDQNGQERYSTEIRGNSLQMLGSKSDTPTQKTAPQKTAQPQTPDMNDPQSYDFDNDIPF